MDKMKQRDSQSTKGVDTGVGEGRSGPVDWHKVGVLADNVEFFASRLLRLKRESVEPFDRGGMSAEELQEHLHSNVGGLLGYNSGASVTSSYWDTQTSGRSSSVGGTGLTTSQFFTTTNMPGFNFGTTPGAAGWVIVDADGSLNNAGGAAGATRPMLTMEYSTTVTNLDRADFEAVLARCHAAFGSWRLVPA